MDETFAPVRAWLDRTRGVSGIHALDADGAVLFSQRADEAFPAASVIKLPLVMALYADAAEGRLSLDERVPVGTRVGGSGVLGWLSSVGELSLRELAALTVSVSDNTAANALIDRLGVGRISERLSSWGIVHSRLQRLLFDMEAKSRGLENLMTPGETALLLLLLLRGECVDPATSEAVIAVLRTCQDETKLRRYLPYGAVVAHKSGWIEGVRNDAAVIWESRPVIVAAFVRETDPAEASILLGLLGWCAYRVAGADVPPLPMELSRPS